MAGLYCALELSKLSPRPKICILEKYKYIGGRTYTYRDKDTGLQWEAGAGRVHYSHHHVTKLIDHYGLTKIPISNHIDWRPSPDVCEPVKIEALVNNLAVDTLPANTLRTSTLKTILSGIAGKSLTDHITDRYEYRSEFDTQRADKALEALNHELGDNERFFVIKEGFSALVGAMKSDIMKAGIKLLREHIATDIEKGLSHYSVHVKDKPTIKAKMVIVAVTRDAVAELPCFKDLPILKQVKMRPLVRIYAVFPRVNGGLYYIYAIFGIH